MGIMMNIRWFTAKTMLLSSLLHNFLFANDCDLAACSQSDFLVDTAHKIKKNNKNMFTKQSWNKIKMLK